jgi:hypothetical protein
MPWAWGASATIIVSAAGWLLSPTAATIAAVGLGVLAVIAVAAAGPLERRRSGRVPTSVVPASLSEGLAPRQGGRDKKPPEVAAGSEAEERRSWRTVGLIGALAVIFVLRDALRDHEPPRDGL